MHGFCVRAFLCNSRVNSKFGSYIQQGLDVVADGEYDWSGEEESLLLPVRAVAAVPEIVGMKSSFIERPRFRLPSLSQFWTNVQILIDKPGNSWRGSSG